MERRHGIDCFDSGIMVISLGDIVWTRHGVASGFGWLAATTYIVGEFGAQVSRGVSKMNPIYRCDRRDCVPLSGLTELNFDHPSS